MDTPFTYHKYVTGKQFVGRQKDVSILSNFLSQCESVALISAPKTGKTSLLQQTLTEMKLRRCNFMVAEVSLLDVRTLEEFLLRLGDAVINVYASTPAEYTRVVEEYLSGTHFVFDPASYSSTGRILSLNWDVQPDDVKSMLRFPYAISASKPPQLFIVLREFQNMSFIDDPDSFFRCFESVMRDARNAGQRQCCFVFMGQRLNAMKEIFMERRFFYRQVELFTPSLIGEKDMKDFISKGFMATGKVVDPDLMLGACRLFKTNVSYLVHFAAICDHLSRGYIMESVMTDALEMLLSIHEPRFIATMAELTTFQVSLLKAIVEGCTRFSSSDVIRKYGLNSSANVKRLKDALVKKEIVTFDQDENPSIIDPLFEYWVGKRFFRMSK